MISSGNSSISLDDILSKVSEFDIVHHYLGIGEIPIVISSPLRIDNNPSFGIYTLNGDKLYWRDLSTGESGGTWDLLQRMWNLNYWEVLEKIHKDLCNITTTNRELTNSGNKVNTIHNYSSSTELECRVREWKKYDIEYWDEFGIDIKWLKYADVYPISHKIVIKDGKRYTFGAEKYAYAYVERKEGKVTLKIYQPFSKTYKWSNKHDRSVISLWTKIPKEGQLLIICSSLKDALCVWSNTGIPCVAIQGEGYIISDTAINELKRRYKNIYILLDNDRAGLLDGEKLSEQTGFINLVLPDYGAKDCSDLFKLLKDKERFKEIIFSLISEKQRNI